MRKSYRPVWLVAGTGALSLAMTTSASASDLVFEFTNPSFGGNPFNSAHLLAVANAQNNTTDPDAVDRSDPAQQFLRTLNSRLLSALATQVTDLIFGENAQDTGTIRFGDQEVSFVRGIESVTLTITNFADGSVTEIVVPLLQP
ncbi:curli assembly protein CsgF [Erythrobacter sp. YT30]|uniref:curli assembly protein CsgF n=1 Tax=Erythrobacter sp. YT30 TaxID=1735012 RepID=UPI000ABB77CD|nr:curli assembly protein CsgF [Erythrobacter sp. YT30]